MKKCLAFVLTFAMITLLAVNVNAAKIDKDLFRIHTEVKEMMETADENDLIPVWIFTMYGFSQIVAGEDYYSASDYMSFSDFMGFGERPYHKIGEAELGSSWKFIAFSATPDEILSLVDRRDGLLKALIVFPYYGDEAFYEYFCSVHEETKAYCNFCNTWSRTCNCWVCVKVRGYIEDEVPCHTIFSVLEILKSLVGMETHIDKCENALNASLITVQSKEKGRPTIFDALEILKKLAGM